MSLTCEDCRDRLLGYLYEELDADERSAVDEALTRCPECRQELAAMRAVASAYDSLPREEFPEKRTLDLIREARLAADARKRRARPAFWLGSLVAVSTLGVIALVNVLRNAAPEQDFAQAPAAEMVAVAGDETSNQAATTLVPTADAPVVPTAPPEAVAAASARDSEDADGAVGANTLANRGMAPAEEVAAQPADRAPTNGLVSGEALARAEDRGAELPVGGAAIAPTDPELMQWQERPAQSSAGERSADVDAIVGQSGTTAFGGGGYLEGGIDDNTVSTTTTRTAVVTSPQMPGEPAYAPPAPVHAAPAPTAAPAAPAPMAADSSAGLDARMEVSQGIAPQTGWGTAGSSTSSAREADAIDELESEPSPDSWYEQQTAAVTESDNAESRRDRRNQDRTGGASRTSSAPAAEPSVFDGDQGALAQMNEEADSAVSASIFDQGNAALAAGQYANADEYFAAFLEIAQAGDTRITGAYLARARCAFALGRPDSARAFIESMLARSPSDQQRREASDLLDQIEMGGQYFDDVNMNRAREAAEPAEP